MEKTIKNLISAIQMTLIIYLVYKINRVKVEMFDGMEKVNSKMESLDLSNIDFINNNKFKESSEVILKMLEFQSKVAASHQAPAISIVNESYTKPLIICSLIRIAATVSCVWWLGHKMVYFQASQINELHFVVAELLRYMPGSNSAKGTTYLTKLNLKVVNTIINEIPNHQVITSGDVSYGLEEFLLKVPGYDSKSVVNVTRVIFLS